LHAKLGNPENREYIKREATKRVKAQEFADIEIEQLDEESGPLAMEAHSKRAYESPIPDKMSDHSRNHGDLRD